MRSWFRVDKAGLTDFIDELIEAEVKPYEERIQELNGLIDELQAELEGLKEKYDV